MHCKTKIDLDKETVIIFRISSANSTGEDYAHLIFLNSEKILKKVSRYPKHNRIIIRLCFGLKSTQIVKAINQIMSYSEDVICMTSLKFAGK